MEAMTSFAADRARRTTQVDRWLAELLGAEADVALVAVGVTGVVLTKLDGTAKGGIVIAVQRELGVPVKLVGLGEGPDDLAPFEPDAFVDAILG